MAAVTAASPRVVAFQLAQDRRYVVVDGAAREDEALGHLGVAPAAGDQAQHLELTRRQVARIGVLVTNVSPAANERRHQERVAADR